MTSASSPFATLGLRAGASRAEVDDAYRRLMKRHHPDLPDGDADQAARINRAYAQLKATVPAEQPAVPMVVPATERARRRARHRGRWVGLAMLAVAIGLAVGLPWPLTAPQPQRSPVAAAQPAAQERYLPQGAGSLPDNDVVSAGVAQAVELQRSGPAGSLRASSRNCERDLATYPSLALLDHCVAFDAATALLNGARGDPRFTTGQMEMRHSKVARQLIDDPALARERVRYVGADAREKLLIRLRGERD